MVITESAKARAGLARPAATLSGSGDGVESASFPSSENKNKEVVHVVEIAFCFLEILYFGQTRVVKRVWGHEMGRVHGSCCERCSRLVFRLGELGSNTCCD